MIDDLYADGAPVYSVKFEQENEEAWTVLHREISQFTRLKGISCLENGQLHLSCADFGEVYTGGSDWKDYKARFLITPSAGDFHLVNVRVQGAVRSYAAGFLPERKRESLRIKTAIKYSKRLISRGSLEKSMK